GRERGPRSGRAGWREEGRAPLGARGEDCDRARVANDLALVAVPELDVDADPRPLEDPPRTVRLHRPTSVRASLPAANADAKNQGSSSAPRPMCSSGSPAHASRQSPTSTS